MSLHAMPHPDGSPKSPSVHQAEDGNGEAGTLGVGSSSTLKQSKVMKPRWTARRTHAQFSLYYFPFTSRRERQEQRDAQLAALSAGKVAEPLENAAASSSAVSTSEEPQAAAAGKRPAVESEPVQSRERLQTHGGNQPLPEPGPSTSATNLTMNDQEICDTKVFDAEAAAVPRTFDYTGLTFSSDESDKDAPAPVQSPNFTAKAPPVHDGPSGFPGAQGLTAASLYGLAPPTTKGAPASTPRRPRTEAQVVNNGESQEYIYIDSSDESDEGEDDTCSPIRRLTLEETSFDIPAMEVPAASVEDVVSPKTTEDDTFAEYQLPSDEDDPMEDVFVPSSPEMARTENESSEDDIPLAILRKNLSSTIVKSTKNENESSEDDIPLAILRKNLSSAIVKSTKNENESSEDDVPLAILRKNLSSAIAKSTRHESESSEDNVPIAFLRTNRSRSKRHLSDDEEVEFAIVCRPAPTPRPRAPSSKKQRDFDSGLFDAMIYSQSEMSPPRGVSAPRPTTATTRAASHDDRRFIAANPAIHGPVKRPEDWWKDKIREIRGRPNRKAWFGRAPERMRWLHQKQRREQGELQRQGRHPGSGRGSKTRSEPQPAGYRRVMDFGDVQEQQLPPLVRSNPEWAKACEWMRAKWKDDGALRRVVEHSTQRTWEHYQNVLQEDDGHDD